MLKWIISLVICLILMAVLAMGLVASPYYFYKQFISGNFNPQWYTLDPYQREMLKPSRYPYKILDQMSADNLWKEFHINDVIIPLPVRHPVIEAFPIFEEKLGEEKLGLSFQGINGEEFSKVYFLPINYFKSNVTKNKLFELPVSEAIIENIPIKILWAEMFSKVIDDKKIDYNQMIYNLFLLELRHIFIPKNVENFGNIGEEDVGIIKLNSKDKDYDTELVMTMKNSVIYSYVLLSKKGSPESQEIRERFLSKIRFVRGGLSTAKIYYKEFKSLEYNRQTSGEGMLFLLASWSNWSSQKESIIKEIIYNLEKGEREKLLKIFYNYAYKKYGSIFSSRKSSEIADPMLRLQRQIEEEDIRNLVDAQNKKFDDTTKKEVKLTAKEKIKLKLEKIKNKRKKKRTLNLN